MPSIADNHMQPDDIDDELVIHREVKAALDNLINVVHLHATSGRGSHATRDRLHELATEIANITPDWNRWSAELQEAERESR